MAHKKGTGTERLDIRVQDEGTLVLLFGETHRGNGWLFANLDPDHQHFGDACVVEPRYVSDIIRGALEAGLRVGTRR